MTELAYILSPSYSGSTLLTFLLGTHPQIATIGELKATARGDMDTYQCSCGARMLDCPFWLRVRQELSRRGVDLDLHDFGTHFVFQDGGLGDKVLRSTYRGGAIEHVRRAALHTVPTWQRRFRGIVERNRALIETIMALQGGDLFLDDSKDAVRLRYLLDSGLWNVKVIRLIRDGRGSTTSYMRIHKLSLPEAAREWRHVQEECERIAVELPASGLLTVGYEKLCRDVEGTLARIFRFLGVDPKAATSDFLSVEHHVLGHAMRLRTNGQVQLNEKWRSTWTAQDLAAFDRVAGEMNRRYGYE